MYGSYSIIGRDCSPFFSKESIKDDEGIKLIYAGSIDSTKGGAYNAVEAFKYLPDNYSLNILGFGNEKDVMRLKVMIDDLHNEKKKCHFWGIKTGDEYHSFLNRCDIALNPQIEGEYMNTAFPSKIVSYLAHNLRVVSTHIKSVEKSALNEFILFAHDDSPQSIAEAIMSIDIQQPYNSRNRIEQLDNEFIESIKKILS